MRGLVPQHGVVAVRQPHQLPAAEVGHHAGEHQREQQEHGHHQPGRAVDLFVALVAQALLGVHEGREFSAHVVAQLLAPALAHRLRVVAAGSAQRDQVFCEPVPGLLQRRDALDPLRLLPVVQHQLAKRGGVALDSWQRPVVGLERAFIAGDQEAAQAGFHVDAAALQLAGAARHAVALLDPADGEQQEHDQADEHQRADHPAQQWPLEVAAQLAVEVVGVDRGRRFHSNRICKQNF